MLLSIQNICKSFGIVPILNNISFHVNARDKVALVGINGAGKSTLFKIIVGELTADSGQIVRSGDTTLGYLSQQQDMVSEQTIYDEVLSVKGYLLQMETDIRKLELEMKKADEEGLAKLMESYSRLNHKFELENGYALRSEVTGILKGLGFTEDEFGKHIRTLSGGQKTRVALSKLLLQKPDIILLDEPTNHLDMEAIAWLETFLSNYSGTVIVIAHDRYFLDKFTTKVVELENTVAHLYEGNYSHYAEQKAKDREVEIKHYLNQQREIKHQEDVIAKLRSFNREKSIKRAESREKMLNKIERLDKPVNIRDEMDIRLSPNILSGNDVLTVSGLSKAFGENQLFKYIDFEIKRGDKMAIIGNNGTGKTTMLKIINGLLDADEGEIRLGAKVFIGYYDQAHQVLDMDKTIIDEIQSTYPKMTNTEVRNALAAFLFTGEDVFKLIRDISGGERGRVSLAKLMLSDANLLILDEPTNHLDMTSKEILEKAISNYTGTVLYVSHDRYFINKTATHIIDLVSPNIYKYVGNYDYYLEKKQPVMQATTSVAAKAAVNDVASENKADWLNKKKEQAQQRKLQNELKRIEDEIEALEERKAALQEELQKDEVFTNHELLLSINDELAETDGRIESLMERWEELSSFSS